MTDLASLATGHALPSHTVRAHNAATASENKIHDDDVARQYGFAGGLVPGVTVYAYMTRPVVEALGVDWLSQGQATVRFLKPFYEGQLVHVRGTVEAPGEAVASIALEAANDDGDVCAAGRAWLPAVRIAPPGVELFPKAPLPGRRPPVSAAALGAVEVLGTVADIYDAGVKAMQFLTEVQDDLALYRGPGAVAHPGILIRYANAILSGNVLLNPWIHVSSDVTHYAVARDGDALTTRGRVTGLFERKGHKFVELDVLTVANDVTPVMRVRHTAIYDVRKVSED